ncbi:hypothetical protein NC651_012078 [Populus alba x Populus x berolinensis]|nr:hypothetical protein NC651_012078 [Populus alba x Populus x berolinensis]
MRLGLITIESYDTISKDIIQKGGPYPFCTRCDGCTEHPEIEQSRSAHIGPFTVIGKGTRIGTTLIFRILSLGKGSYIWDSVTIEDGCDISHAIICDGVVIKSGAVLETWCGIVFQGCDWTATTVEDSDEELEYADNSSGTLGPGGVGHVWSICEGGHEEEWRHSVAPIPADKLAEATQSLEDDLEFLNLDGNALSTSGELKPGRNGTDSEDDEAEDSRDDSIYYEKEVEATFLRAVNENIKVPDVILEMKLSAVVIQHDIRRLCWGNILCNDETGH